MEIAGIKIKLKNVRNTLETRIAQTKKYLRHRLNEKMKNTQKKRITKRKNHKENTDQVNPRRY